MQCIVVWMDVKVFRFCNLNAFYCKIFAAFVVFTMLNSSSTANVYLIWAYVVNTTTTSKNISTIKKLNFIPTIIGKE